ncbi:GNAT family N-acetyltransferase [Paenibacillus sp. EC2-1]|uniref:GNAT family N-acetyltransferase n=1 Tax=Paenibacillus sp. EC2-1 TaxID=3388665 RepID=UPI003BEEF956
MYSIIRKLESSEIPSFVDIAINAYPARVISGTEFRERQISRMTKIQNNIDNVNYYGLYREDRLIAGMRLHEYSMNLYGRMIQVGGVGQVAVDLLHKKERAAKEMIEYFIAHCKSKGISLVLLYPFRPDFYKKMGFGYGTKMNQYYIKPDSFPKAFVKQGLVWLDHKHINQIKECSDRHASTTHGMIFKSTYELDSILSTAGSKAIGYMENGGLKGYIIFNFKNVKTDNFLLNDLVIQEFVYESSEALKQLGTFLHTQNDQIHRIVWSTQDDMIEHWIEDPRNGSDRLLPSVFHESHISGVGLMYKIIDIPKFMIELGLTGAIYSAEPLTLQFMITDSFSSDERFSLHIDKGSVAVTMGEVEEAASIEMNISDFSSLFMGVVDVDKLYQYGKIHASDLKAISLLRSCLKNNVKPFCSTAF